jgi:epoxyqueuosine reductase QueG
VVPSPIGTLIHPDYGLWHAYRGALVFAEHIALPPSAARPSPCETCQDKPCLSACPVNAFASGGYAVNACLDHISGDHGAECLHRGCLARRACPVGQRFRYSTEQTRFHMEAFLRNARS